MNILLPDFVEAELVDVPGMRRYVPRQMRPSHSHLRNEMLTCFCLRFPQEAILVVIDRFDATPQTFWNHGMFAACLVPAARSVVAESIRLSVQSALKRALNWSIGCPLVLLGSVPLKKT